MQSVLDKRDWFLVLRSNLIIGLIWSVLFYAIIAEGRGNSYLVLIMGKGLLLSLILCQLANLLLLMPWKGSKVAVLVALLVIFLLLFTRHWVIAIYYLAFPVINFISIGLRRI